MAERPVEECRRHERDPRLHATEARWQDGRETEVIAAREELQHGRARTREDRMTREVLGERWRQVGARVVRRPLFARDLLDRPPRATPGADGLSLLHEADRRDRTHPV